MEGMKSKLSTLWIFATLNYLYCDVVTLMDHNLLRQFLAGNVGGADISQGFLLAAGVLVEIPMAMVLLSRVLGYRANRWANALAGAIMTVVQLGTLATKTPALYYVFFTAIEISCTAVIVWLAWRWREETASLTSDAERIHLRDVWRSVRSLAKPAGAMRGL